MAIKNDDEEDRLNKAITNAEEAEKIARDMNTELQQKLTKAKTHIVSLKKRIEKRKPELKKEEADFSTALTPAGFEDEKAFLEARMPYEERDFLSTRAKKSSMTRKQCSKLNRKNRDRLDHGD